MRMQIIRVDCRSRTLCREVLPEDLLTIGGRGVIDRVLTEEVPPRCDPLGPENKLIVCCGPLAGVGVTSAGRLSIGGKSPLTGGIKESNSGGTAADALARLGIRCLILEGQPEQNTDRQFPETSESWYLLKVDERGVEFLDASKYMGLGNYACRERLAADFGNAYSTITIGPSGERRYLNSGLAVNDRYGRPGRFSARGGMGALMGSKKIKAILISNDGNFQPPGITSEEFRAARRRFHMIVKGSERIKVLREYGTASTVLDAQRLGALPTRNFSAGQFAGAGNISGEALHDLIAARGGEGTNSESCMGNCMIQCSNYFADSEGRSVVGPLEYETLSLMGSNLGIDDLDVIARLNYICNDLGLDTIETGGALGVMAAAGLLEFGDAQGFIAVLEDLPKGGLLGRMVGMGTGITARFLNVRHAPVVKNQCMSGYDPRGVKGTGVTYATTPMGADHTAGLTVYMPVDHHAPEGQVELSKKMQIGRTAYDVLGLCTFLMAATALHGDAVVGLLNGLYGLELAPDYLRQLGEETIAMERAYNSAAGFTAEDDRIPAYFREEKLPPFGLRWDVEDNEIDAMFGGA